LKISTRLENDKPLPTLVTHPKQQQPHKKKSGKLCVMQKSTSAKRLVLATLFMDYMREIFPMLNFSMFIKGKNVTSEIVEDIVTLLPQAAYASIFTKDADELTSELIDMVVSFGFVTDGVIGLTKVENGALTQSGDPKTPSSFVNFKRPPVTAFSLAQARARAIQRGAKA
jgi:hypothetical protein